MLKNKAYFFVSIIILAFSINSKAQDFHFSQFYNFPVAINPAMTGKIKEDFRISLIHRSQWKQINSPYTTSALSADMNFRNLPLNIEKAGVGIYLMNDELGDGIFKNQSFMVSGAVHKAIDNFKRHVFSLGIQTGYVRKNLNNSNLVFKDQNVNYQFSDNPSVSADGVLSGNNYNFINFNSGVNYNFLVNEKVDLTLGASFFNLTTPKETFVSSAKNKLPRRYLLTFGTNIKIMENFTVMPAVMYMRQAEAVDLNMGSGFAYHFNQKKDITAILGLWYRNSDAVILLAGLKYKNYQANFSYDASISNVKSVKDAPNLSNAKVNAFEISVSYLGFLNRALPNDVTIPCRFF
ncbi:MAG TPA: PorP/SprF family type IX secretion system membrane protein [Cytophagaceae bacterium]|jgi:type IX secretion system PorP/SprF family membrane protein